MTALPPTLRVFVNERVVEVPRGATVADAVRAHDDAAADAVSAGERAVADSRGLPVDPHAATYAGAIYRLISARRPAGADDTE
ncbi:MAG: hypothetical protein ACXW05_21435 [Gemmatirosa sp.]